MWGQEDALSWELNPVLSGQPREDTGHAGACATQDIPALVSAGPATVSTHG